MKPLFEKAEAKNKLLRSVAGGGVESLSQLQARWDKFELMMESHQLMVKEQVSGLFPFFSRPPPPHSHEDVVECLTRVWVLMTEL